MGILASHFLLDLFNAIANLMFLLLLDPINVFCLAFLFLNTFGYLLVLKVIAGRRHRSESSEPKKGLVELDETTLARSQLPTISFIIPAHNEERSIERKLENTFSLNYPKDRLEVIVVNDGSTDKTLNVLKEARRSRFPELKIITQSRKGKSAAENKGLQNSKGEIIVLSDADVPLNSNSLLFMAEVFQDIEVGGVTCAIEANESVFALNLDMGYYARKLENAVDSPWGMSGPFVSFRRSIMPKIDEGIFASDCDKGVTIRKRGYKVVYDPRIISHVNQWVEGQPRSMASALKKLKHMFFGDIHLFLRHNDILFRKQYGVYGWFIAPRYLLLSLFAPIVFMLLSVNFVINLVKSSLLMPFLLLVALFLVVTRISREIAPYSTISKALYLILIYVVYYYVEIFYYFIFILRPSERRGIWDRYKI